MVLVVTFSSHVLNDQLQVGQYSTLPHRYGWVIWCTIVSVCSFNTMSYTVFCNDFPVSLNPSLSIDLSWIYQAYFHTIAAFLRELGEHKITCTGKMLYDCSQHFGIQLGAAVIVMLVSYGRFAILLATPSLRGAGDSRLPCACENPLETRLEVYMRDLSLSARCTTSRSSAAPVFLVDCLCRLAFSFS